MINARVLVVGAGVAGLAVARALAHARFAVDIVEREAAWNSEGAGIFLPGNAVRALRALDLDEAALARAVVIPYQRFSDHRGQRLFEVDVAAMWHDVGPCIALHRAELHGVLLAGASDVPIRMGVEVHALRQHGGQVSVESMTAATAITTSYSARTESTAAFAAHTGNGLAVRGAGQVAGGSCPLHPRSRRGR
jgi:2-polyprenyl-6-methoxyphenol hydroxylase-like FAD-dependent oxidoreductase